MKRVFALISMASAATAAGIRGDAVEEVGEAIEHYPPPHHGGYDRRSLLDEMEMDAEILGSYEVTDMDAKESFPDEGSVEVSCFKYPGFRLGASSEKAPFETVPMTPANDAF